MLPNTISSQKRKHSSEYHDPDYIRLYSSPYKKLRHGESNIMGKNVFLTPTKTKLKCISEIISNEFQKEISLKQEHLAAIEKRLDQARSLLDRLRYVIVSDYYQKQDLSISAYDTLAIRGKETLFEKEVHGLQIALHPSFKKRMGDYPNKMYEVTQRSLPERVAAQNALNTLRSRSQSQKHQKKCLKQSIKDQGLVIHHSKEKEIPIVDEVNTFDQMRSHNNDFTDLQSSKTGKMASFIQSETRKSLNSARFNNKTKHLVVIGNTSTYIGGEVDARAEVKISSENMLTHKWLVYVQSKDAKINLESFIKKVRFHLHPSYRPNDIVDIRTAPFQIARRGWGEFPMRIQLFFHEHLQQKPVQLIHNVVLDRTLSGMHTLGSETLMEIWIRSDIIITKAKDEPLFDVKKNVYENIQPFTSENIFETGERDHGNNTKHRKISFTNNKEDLDDNLFGVFNMDSASADITKIEPSVVVNEQLANISNNSPIKIICKSLQKSDCSSNNEINDSPLSKDKIVCANSGEISELNSKRTSEEEIFTKSVIVSQSSTSNISNTRCNISNLRYAKIVNTKSTNKNSDISKEVVTTIKSSKSMQLTTPMIMKLSTTNVANAHQVSNTNRNNNNIVALSKVGKFMPLKITNMNKFVALNSNSAFANMPVENADEKTVLQKKLVQLVDAEGKIKFMQVLVATTQKPVGDAKMGSLLNGTADSSQNLDSVLSESRKKNTFTDSSLAMEKHASKLLTVSNDVNRSNFLVTNNNGNFLATNNIYNSKSKNNSVSSQKQMVFQKGGKLFIIDPLQMKLKQERKKQVSLLKPQTNLQRQHQQQMPKQKVQHKALQSMLYDHDYTHSSVKLSKDNITLSNPEMISGSIKSHVPELHLGIRQTRAKASSAFELLQQCRSKFEQEFLNQNYNSMNSAIDYILRHLPLISPKNTLASAFSFVSNSEKEFDLMPVLKQRACEWLRAKYITCFVRNHKYLKAITSNNKWRFWSTREVLVYARYHAFTPKMKSFDITLSYPVQVQNMPDQLTEPEKLQTDNLLQGHDFSQFVKNEVKFEQKYIQYESITPKHRITSWLDCGCQNIIDQETGVEFSEEPIDIISISMSKNRNRFNIEHLRSNPNRCEQEQQFYLAIPEHLEKSSQLVSDICRDFNIQLQPEQIGGNLIYPLAQTVLSQCLNTFIEKIIRRAVASKQNPPTTDSLNITTQDIGNVLVRHAEFDFLTNKYFGIHKDNSR
ncbi:PREDICTED: uncharacterized protein LOC108975116 isoform X1 [Bactrocera latifrons]|nr:PREDICTED: uncharacterized protein LOC108975116 isoform X1 [Bactrocera latifrons]XP_018798950.1 PREDICTED: uncharacterized protein LOC108975116 isoform X1 [Bactrocera latifrons]